MSDTPAVHAPRLDRDAVVIDHAVWHMTSPGALLQDGRRHRIREASAHTRGPFAMAKTTTRTAPKAVTRATNGKVAHASRLSPEPHLAQRAPEVQRYGTLRQVPIALATDARAESTGLLNEILADTTVLYAMYKKHHWLVAGPTFYQLHLLFDKHAGEQLELVDEIAERVQMLGGIAVGDPRHAAELTTIPRPPDGAEPVPVMIDRLLDAHEIVIEKLRKAIKATEANGDFGTNDLLMGDVLRRHELQVWFLSEHVVDMPLVDAVSSIPLRG
jgi:starvation-inducible DNA-binding protein